IQNFAVSAPVINTQRNLLREMLWPLRFRLLEDAELLQPGSGMSASQYLATIQKGLFRELAQPNPKIDITRRELQRTYFDQLKAFSGEIQRLNNVGDIQTALQSDFAIDLRPAALEALKQLKISVTEGSNRSHDQATRLHLTQLAREIEQIVKIQGS
ncbi:MAG: hypothetical protein JNM52_02510, partial [Betaproteobacteria bacterium]|nr:hypothetical protein [Betaproteobacteria bacterium]